MTRRRYRHEDPWAAWLAWFRAGGRLRWLAARWWERRRRRRHDGGQGS